MLMDLESLGSLGFFFSCGSLSECQNDICCPVLFYNSTEQGNPTKASGTLMI
jgi:hypothetical protein